MTYQDKYAAGVSKDAADLQNDARTSARIGTRLTHECSRSDLITQLCGIVRRERNPKRKEATSLLVEMLENDQPAKGIERQVRVPLRQDGLPCASQAGKRYDDPGVAVFFTLKGKALSMARDRYYTPWENIRSLILAINAIRSIERHGGSTMMERASSGFAAIAPPDWKKPWREVFGVKPDWRGDIAALYREKARSRHPDAGGSDTLMAELNVAYEEAKRDLGAN